MFKYEYNGQLLLHDGVKIRDIKSYLMSETSLSNSNAFLSYKNLVLEDHQRIENCEIDTDDVIWFGTLSDYNKKFNGDYVIVDIKSRNEPNTLGVTEKVLIEKSGHISQIREILMKKYKWIEKVKFCNYKLVILMDNQTLKDCDLLEQSTIIINSPIFAITTGSLNEKILFNSNEISPNYKRYNTKIRMKFSDNEMSLFMELIQIMIKPINSNKSIDCFISRIFDCIGFPEQEDLNPKMNLINFMSEWVKYYVRIENKKPLLEDRISVYRQDFRDALGEVGPDVDLGTPNDHLDLMHQLFAKCVTILKSFFPLLVTSIIESTAKSIQSIFDAYYIIWDTQNEDYKFVDLRLLKILNSYFDKILENGFPLNENDLMSKISKLYPDILLVSCKLNTVVNSYWTDKDTAFSNLYVNSNLNNENPIQIMKPTEITVSNAIETLSNYNLINQNSIKRMHFISRDREIYYSDNETLQHDATIAFIETFQSENFEKIKRLGKGAYGSVCIYLRKLSNQEVVLKKLRFNYDESKDKNVLDKFEDKKIQVQGVMRELIAFSKLAPHNRIIQYYNYYKNDRYFYIEMEYMKGGSLLNYINRKPLSKPDLKKFSYQILEGLKYLHDKKMFHRDIKSENILLDENNNAKLADFGLTKCYYGSMEDYQKGFKLSGKGTKWWMAPEISDISGEYGPLADVWSFGVTVVEMASGYTDSKLRSAENYTQIYRHSIDSQVKDLIDSCLQRNPIQRSNVDQLFQALIFKETD